MDFQQAEKRFKQLKNQFKSGTLSEPEFKTQLEELMVQDERGDWWMIGYETERWYRHDGTNWVQVDRPGSLFQESTPVTHTEPETRVSKGTEEVIREKEEHEAAEKAAKENAEREEAEKAIKENPKRNAEDKITVHPKWMSVLWITLGWTIGWAIGWATNWQFGEAIVGLIDGAIGGLITALILRRENVLSNKKGMFWIALSWAAVWTIAEVSGGAIYRAVTTRLEIVYPIIYIIGGIIGGLITAIILRQEKFLSNKKSMFWIVLGWAIGWGIAEIIGTKINGEIAGPVRGITGGAIGSFVTIFVIKKNQNNGKEV